MSGEQKCLSEMLGFKVSIIGLGFGRPCLGAFVSWVRLFLGCVWVMVLVLVVVGGAVIVCICCVHVVSIIEVV